MLTLAPVISYDTIQLASFYQRMASFTNQEMRQNSHSPCISPSSAIYYIVQTNTHPLAMMKRSNLPGIAESRRVVRSRLFAAGEGRFGAGFNEWLHTYNIW